MVENIFYANRRENKTRETIFLSDKIDFKAKFITKMKVWHYIMIRVSIQEKNIAFIDMQHKKHLNI